MIYSWVFQEAAYALDQLRPNLKHPHPSPTSAPVLPVPLHHLRLDVAEGLREVQVEGGLVGVLAPVLDLQGQLEALLAAHKVLHQVPGQVHC